MQESRLEFGRGVAGWCSASWGQAGGRDPRGRGLPCRVGRAAQVNTWGPCPGVKGRDQTKVRGFTCDVYLICRRCPDFQLQAPTALGVVHPAQRGHAAHTASVHVHLAACGDETGGRGSGRPPLQTPSSSTTRSPDSALGKGPRSARLWQEQPAETHRSISCPGAPARRGGSRSGRKRWGCCSCADGTCACSGGPAGREETSGGPGAGSPSPLGEKPFELCLLYLALPVCCSTALIHSTVLSAYCVPGLAVNKQIKTPVPMQFTF